MKKLITTLAVAGLGAAFVAGAQAQTFGPTNTTGAGGIYTLSVLENTAPSTLNVGDYTYSYLVTLTGDSSGTVVNQFNINNIQGFVGNVTVKQGVNISSGYASDFAEFGSPTTSGGYTSLSFQAPAEGLTTPGSALPKTGSGSYDFTSLFGPDTTGYGDSAVFTFDSSLPPGGTVSLGSNGFGGTSAGGVLSGTGGSEGPGPLTATVPETSSFALLGLGLLPLALIARRRLARNN